MRIRFRSRTFVERYVATLSALGESGGAGEAEREEFANGDQEFELRVRGIALPDGAQLRVAVNDRAVAATSLRRGKGKLKLESDEGHTVPHVGPGDRLTVSLEGLPPFRPLRARSAALTRSPGPLGCETLRVIGRARGPLRNCDYSASFSGRFKPLLAASPVLPFA